MKDTAITFFVASLLLLSPIGVSTVLSDVSPPIRGNFTIPSDPIRPLPYCTDLYIEKISLDDCATRCNVSDGVLLSSITVTVGQRDPKQELGTRRCPYKPARDYEITLLYTNYLTNREETLKYAFVVGGPQQILDRKLFYIQSRQIKIEIKPRGNDMIDLIKNNNSAMVGFYACVKCDEDPGACMN